MFECPACGKKIEQKAAMIAHCRTHLKNKELVEGKDQEGKFIFFKPTNWDNKIRQISNKEYELDLSTINTLNIKDYYITTGEAIVKLDVFANDLINTIGKVKELRELLTSIKGESKWLETSWEGGNIRVIKKESRSGKEEEE